MGKNTKKESNIINLQEFKIKKENKSLMNDFFYNGYKLDFTEMDIHQIRKSQFMVL